MRTTTAIAPSGKNGIPAGRQNAARTRQNAARTANAAGHVVPADSAEKTRQTAANRFSAEAYTLQGKCSDCGAYLGDYGCVTVGCESEVANG